MYKMFDRKRSRGKISIIIPVIIMFLLINTIPVHAIDTLTITAPDTANVGEQITITVKANGNPVIGASVLIDGLPVGDTDSNGRVHYTFSIFGIYLISATKLGYWPSDVHPITVNNPLLIISADPAVCNAGDTVTFTITANLAPVQSVTVSSNGENLGTTNGDGIVTHTFATAGTFSITAHKTGYTDAVPYSLIVTAISPLLVITANPPACNAGDTVEFTITANLAAVQGVSLSSNGDNIGVTNSNGKISQIFSTAGTFSITAHKAGYTDAVPYSLIVTAISPLLVITANPPACNAGDLVEFTVTANLAAVQGVTVSSNGASIGTTNSNGHVLHTFDTAGTFSITAHKTGYTDAIPYSLVVTAISPLLVITANPPACNARDTVTFTVTANLANIQGVTVYSNGASIGTTDSNGHVTHVFPTGGTFSITAHKTGYSDAIAYSLIVASIEPLLIITADPAACNIGDQVTFTITANLAPVQGAIVSSNGQTIGTTDSNGYVIHTFTNTGTYSITAHKTGNTDAIAYSMIVTDIHVLENVSFQGAVFPVPTSLIAGLPTNENIPFQMPYTSLILTSNKFYLVFSNNRIQNGLASVKGLSYLDTTWEGLTVGVVQAETVSVSTDGTQTTIAAIKANPNAYTLKLVKLDAHLLQCPFQIDVSLLRTPITIGKVCSGSSSMDFSQFINNIYALNQNVNTANYQHFLDSTGDNLAIVDFQHPDYWIDSQASINAIVLDTGLVTDFLNTVAGSSIKEVALPSGDAVYMYNVNTEPEGISTTIEAIIASPEQFNGKVVTFEGSDLGVNVSVKSILGSLGIPVPADITLHGNVIWSRPPPSNINEISSKTLLSIGASSIHQDRAITLVNGALQVYRYTGKIIAASTMQGSLSGSLFIMYKREKIQTLSSQELSAVVQQKIQDTVTNLKFLCQRQTPDIVTIPVISQETPGVIQINKGNVENITLHLRNQAENVSIAVLKFENKPAEVTANVTGEVYSYIEITVQNIIEDDVNNAAISFKVDKAWISSNNIDVTSIKLQRYSDGSWSVLTTNKLSEDGMYLYFSANSPGFSIYAITASKEQAPTASVSTPGFEVVVVLMALVAIALYRYNKKE